jgi:hypothetical protein
MKRSPSTDNIMHLDIELTPQQQQLLRIAVDVRGPVDYERFIKRVILSEARSVIRKFIDGAHSQDNVVTLPQAERRLANDIAKLERQLEQRKRDLAALPQRL